ncbi:MAG: ATP-binding cassette domain-containing protein [Spirochaetaceae bacterium]|nr:ATP-binding cassette domain-containing protein [Spirochaetaceae bacterium]
MSVISVEQLKFKYQNAKKNAVDGVSFCIEKGAYTAIVGSNGSGKSTLARLLCGLETPLEGSIQVQENQNIGIVFQSPKDQIVSSIVSRDTSFGPKNLKLKKGEIELRTIESLSVVDLLDKANDSTSALSLGQTQKAALSGIIALHPEILILDEAISMLDPTSREDILQFVKRWQKYGNTIIHITHDIEVVKQADNVIAMENGKIFFYGKSSAFLTDENNVFRLNGDPLEKKDKSLWNKSKKEVVVKFEDVCFNYNEKSSVDNISFELYKGSITALTGSSGAGKSTILELAAGLLEQKSGFISGVRGALAQQNAQAALFEQFAGDDVAFGPRNFGKSGKELVEIVKKSMNQAGIPFEEFSERQTVALSGGEKRRLSIAGIIALDNDVLLFDEPTAGLDSKSRTQVMKMMEELASEGKTILFSTHRMDEADFAHREIKVEQGKIIFDSYDGEQIIKNIPIEKTKVENTKVKKSEKEEFFAYSCASLIENLRQVTVNLSGSKNSKTNHLIPKLHPVFRIILFLVLFVVSLCVRDVFTCSIMFGITVIYGLLCGFSIKGMINSFVKILPFLLLFSIFQLMFHPALPNEVRFTTWKWFMITPSKLIFCLATIIRTFACLACICGFFVSTPEYDLLDGLQILLKPLEVVKIPVRNFILIIEIIFRFIPLLIEEATSILKTQSIRGGLGKVSGKMAKIKAIVPLIVPLIVQTIKRSENLADAITVRKF